MRREMRAIVGFGVSVGFAVSVLAGPAGAATGAERFSGFLIATGRSGGRGVLATGIQADGVFNGHGRIVEVDNQPGDPDDVSRDDLVFADGTMHLITTTLDATFSVDPRSCRVELHLDQVGTIAGGTGRFTQATGSFTGSVDATALVRRLATGECDVEGAPVIERDDVTGSGTLSF